MLHGIVDTSNEVQNFTTFGVIVSSMSALWIFDDDRDMHLMLFRQRQMSTDFRTNRCFERWRHQRYTNRQQCHIKCDVSIVSNFFSPKQSNHRDFFLLEYIEEETVMQFQELSMRNFVKSSCSINYGHTFAWPGYNCNTLNHWNSLPFMTVYGDLSQVKNVFTTC